MVISAVRLAMRCLCSMVFLCLLLCGCMQDSATTQGGSATIEPAEQAREASGFIAYVVELDNGGSQAVVCYPDQDHKETVMTREPGERPPHLWILPSDVLRSTPYMWRDGQVVEQNWAPSEHREVYLDSMSGKVVQPDAALGLDEYWRRQLVDLVGDRAIVLEYEADCDPFHPTAKVCLFQGTDLTQLGRVFVEHQMSSGCLPHHSLSPDRNYLSWSGPEGTFWCDLRTARIHAQDLGGIGRPDARGFIKEWQDDAGIWRWELFDAATEQSVASGQNRVFELSADFVYWTLVNDEQDCVLLTVPDVDASADSPAAKLLLSRGASFAPLGRVFMAEVDGSILLKHYSLSADRKYLSWSGPDGSYWCEFPEAGPCRQRRNARGLPDGSGVIEEWRDYPGTWHWRLFDGDSEQAVARGEGRIREVSPDGVCWAIGNEAWTRAKYREPDDPPYFVQLIPGREPSPETRLADGPWAIEGADVRLFAAGWHSENETLLYRITPQGHVAFVLEGKSYGKPRVLQLEDGGRVGISLDDQLVILDFDGNEKLRTEATFFSRSRGHALLPAPSEGNFLCIAARTLGRWRIDRFNFITGGVETVLTCDAQSLEVHRIGNSYFAAAHHGKGKPPWALQAPWDLYLGDQDGKHWQLLAKSVRKLRWGPVE